MFTIREVALVVLTLVVSSGGFVAPPSARRQRPNARRGGIGDTATDSRLDRRSSAAPGVVEMSIREMIGADVETGGLFDPLGTSNWQGASDDESKQEMLLVAVRRLNVKFRDPVHVHMNSNVHQVPGVSGRTQERAPATAASAWILRINVDARRGW